MREATLFSDRSSIRLKSRRGRRGWGRGVGNERGSGEGPRWVESGSLNMGVAS